MSEVTPVAAEESAAIAPPAQVEKLLVCTLICCTVGCLCTGPCNHIADMTLLPGLAPMNAAWSVVYSARE
jgi:hypothetical protein